MRSEFKTLDVPQTIAASPGTPLNVENFRDKSVLLYGWTTGTLQIHGSNDGTNFGDLTGNITAPGFVDLPKCVQWIQIVCTVNITVGTAEASFGGFQSRTDAA